MNKTFYTDNIALAEELASSIAQNLQTALEKNKHATLILPGGSSPVELITALARHDLPWDEITITTTDERAVPHTHKDSNAGQVQRLFAAEGLDINPLWLTEEGAFGQIPFPATVTVLGMGTDAHIASLFPGAPDHKGKAIIKAGAPNPPHERLSLTLETLLDTERLILLVSGPEKLALCQRALAAELPGTPLAQLLDKAKEKLELHISGV